MKRLSLVYGVCIGLSFFMHANFPIIQLSSIDLAQCQMIKSALERKAWRKVYVSDSFFYKIWDKNFYRSPYFLDGVRSGFYDEQNTPLEALIYDQGACRGYVTRMGTYPSIAITDKAVIMPVNMQQNQIYIDFYNDLLERTNQSRYVYSDLTLGNIIVEDDRIKLIDLESLLPIGLLNNRQFFNNKAYPEDYRFYIGTLKNQRLMKSKKRKQHGV